MKKFLTLKAAKRVGIVGALGFFVHTIGRLETRRQAAEAQANTISAMLGSLVGYVGSDVVDAWQKNLVAEEDIKEGAADGD